MWLKCTKMLPRGSKYTAALKTCPKLDFRTEVQPIIITSGTESAIPEVVDYKILMIWWGMTPLRHLY